MIEILIYSYMAMCVCILLYNVFYISYMKNEKVYSKAKTNKWRNIIEMRLNDDTASNVRKHKKILRRKLLSINQLYTYNEAVDILVSCIPEVTKRYITDNIDIFVYLLSKYSNMQSVEKAYLANIVPKYMIFDSGENDRIAELLIYYTMDKSIYCRENALRALYAVGNSKYILSAYKLMNRNKIYHNVKLSTDGLMLFKGDKDELCNTLYESITEFDSSYQVAFVNFIKLVSGAFCEQFLSILQKGSTDSEVKFAIIRYYRKYYYLPAREYLFSCIKFQDELEFTFSALAASSLENYPSNETVKILKTALKSNNWYIRNNASASLQKVGVKYTDIMDIFGGDDRYAREMLNYKMNEGVS